MFGAFLVPTILHAQQSALSGTWYGIINDYSFGEPRRTLNILDSNGTWTCTWQEIGKSIDRAGCTVQSDKITLTTGAGSAVELSSKGNTLQGTFTLKDGRMFSLSMGREPVPQPQLTRMTADEIRSLVVGKEFQISTNAIVTYKADGSYIALLLNGGGRQHGVYRITNTAICIDFHNGDKRCDQILKDQAGRYYFNSRNQYPMTPR